jgi:hypothetical protein
MYEPNQSLSILYLTSTQKIYTKASVVVSIYSTENIPYPPSGDIIITDRGSVGKDVDIKLTVNGAVSERTKNESLVVKAEILNPGQELNEQGVRNYIGSQVFNVTTTVYKNNKPQGSNTGVLTSESDIEID